MKMMQGEFSIFKTRPLNDKLFAQGCSIHLFSNRLISEWGIKCVVVVVVEDSRERFKSLQCLTSHMTRTGLHDSPAAVRKCVF